MVFSWNHKLFFLSKLLHLIVEKKKKSSVLRNVGKCSCFVKSACFILKGIENYVPVPVGEHFWTFKMELIFISLIHNKFKTVMRKYELQRWYDRGNILKIH